MEVHGCQNNVSLGLYLHVTPPFSTRSDTFPFSIRSHSSSGHLILLGRGRRHIDARINSLSTSASVTFFESSAVVPRATRFFVRSTSLFLEVRFRSERNSSIIYLRGRVLRFETISRVREQSSINARGFARRRTRWQWRTRLSYNVVRVWRIQVGHAPRADLKGLDQGRRSEGQGEWDVYKSRIDHLVNLRSADVIPETARKLFRSWYNT